MSACQGTKYVSGHKRVWTQTYMFLPRHDCDHTIITCQGTNVSGHKHVWAQSCLGTIVSGHNRVWAQSCGLKYVWAQSCSLRATQLGVHRMSVFGRLLRSLRMLN